MSIVDVVQLAQVCRWLSAIRLHNQEPSRQHFSELQAFQYPRESKTRGSCYSSCVWHVVAYGGREQRLYRYVVVPVSCDIRQGFRESAEIVAALQKQA